MSSLSTYAFRLAAFLKSLRRLYSTSFHICFFHVVITVCSYFLVLLVLLCSRTRYAGLFTCLTLEFAILIFFRLPLSHSLGTHKQYLSGIRTQEGHWVY